MDHSGGGGEPLDVATKLTWHHEMVNIGFGLTAGGAGRGFDVDLCYRAPSRQAALAVG